MLCYIKYLPKDKLLYNLWLKARTADILTSCLSSDLPLLTPQIAKDDVDDMIKNQRDISVTIYYGRSLFVNLTNDYFDTSGYNMYNGVHAAEYIVNLLKKEEIQKCVMKYHLF